MGASNALLKAATQAATARLGEGRERRKTLCTCAHNFLPSIDPAIMLMMLAQDPPPYGNRTKTVRKPYENRTKAVRKPYENRTKTVRKPYGNRTETVRKPYGNRTETVRIRKAAMQAATARLGGGRERRKKLCAHTRNFFAFSRSCHYADDVGPGPTPIYGNSTKTVRKPYGNRTETVRKPYGNRTEAVRKPYGNRTKAVRKPYESRTETVRKRTELTWLRGVARTKTVRKWYENLYGLIVEVLSEELQAPKWEAKLHESHTALRVQWLSVICRL